MSSPRAGGRDLADPAVPAAEYDREYFLHGCMGADVWRESQGKAVAGLYPGMLQNDIGFRPGMRLLDVGTGRGELVRVAAELGAAEAVGIDYSEDAIELARETLAASGSPAEASVMQADARDLPFPDAAFDLVTMLDVVEHLDETELPIALAEVARVVKPGGELFVHTAPNRLVYDVTYRFQRRLTSRRAHTWAPEPRSDYELRMHVNEQTTRSLAAALERAGFVGVRTWLGRWVHDAFVPDPGPRRLYRRLASVPGLRRFGVFDLFGRARSPA